MPDIAKARREATGLGPWQRTLLHLIARRWRRFVSRRGFAARCGFIAAADDGKRRLLARPTDRLDRIEVAAVTGDDTIEFSQSFDLINDHPAHLRGILRRLLRQLEHSATQFSARRLEFAAVLQMVVERNQVGATPAAPPPLPIANLIDDDAINPRIKRGLTPKASNRLPGF